MPVVAADLIEPSGPVQPGMFPDDERGDVETEGTLEHRLTRYIADGVARVGSFMTANPESSLDADAATRAWALFRAFEAVYLRLSSTPANASLNDQGSRSWLNDQIQTFGRRRSEYRDEFDGMLERASVSSPRLNTGTYSVPNEYTW